MRIISKQHDYYDGGVVNGIDKSILYIRECSVIKLPPDLSKIKMHNFNFVIGFCGKLYPLIKEEDIVFYDEEAKKYEFKEVYKSGYKQFEVVARSKAKYFVNSIEREYSDLENNSWLKGLFLEHKVPVFVIASKWRDLELTLNPVLKDYNFFRKFDTVQAFQEIEMFISNILVTDFMKVPDRTNEEIGTSKGFDKDSFKNSKGKSKKF